MTEFDGIRKSQNRKKSLLNPRFFLISNVQNQICRAENIKKNDFCKNVDPWAESVSKSFFAKNIQFPEYPNNFSERMLLYWHSPNVGLECCVNGPFKYWLKDNQYVESKQQKSGSKTLNYFRIYSYVLMVHWFTLWKRQNLMVFSTSPCFIQTLLCQTYTENEKFMNFHWF